MKKEKLQCATALNISIVGYLKKEGFCPKKENEKEAWFISPFRTENDASLKVSKQLNRWFDHGSGNGGNIIDLVTLLHCCDVTKALELLSENRISFSFQQQENLASTKKNDHIRIEKAVDLQHPALIGYLESRCIIPSAVNCFARQVHYNFRGHRYFAIGLSNNAGGWELRNKFYKNSSSPKSYSLFSTGKEMLCICEGMFDFFSLLTLYPSLPNKSDFLVLNSLAFIDHILNELQSYTKVCLYLDRDLAGTNASRKIQATFSNCVDMSAMYEGYCDLNDYLMAFHS